MNINMNDSDEIKEYALQSFLSVIGEIKPTVLVSRSQDDSQTSSISSSISSSNIQHISRRIISGTSWDAVAYNSDKLPFHTDGTYMMRPPDIVILQCIIPSSISGGKEFLVDSFKLAKYMKKYYKDEFEYLCNTSVVFRYLPTIWKNVALRSTKSGIFEHCDYSVPNDDNYDNF